MKENGARILVIEDDFIIAANLQEDLQQLGFGVVGVAGTLSRAEKLFSVGNANLIIADINLEQTSSIDGIDIARRLNRLRTVPIIFLTAYYNEEYRRRAKQLLPASYLLKPVHQKQLDIAVDFALNRTQRLATTSIPSTFRERKVFLRKGAKHVGVPVMNICFLTADGSNCILYTEAERHFITDTLSNVIQQIGGDDILRVHRSHAVNRHRLHSFTAQSLHILRDSELVEIPYTATYAEDIMHFVQKV